MISKNLFVCFVVSAVLGSLGIIGTAAAQPLVNFEGLTPGTSVEGLGTVHPLLNIDAINGTAVVIRGGVPGNFGAPNIPGLYPPNNCLENAAGVRVDYRDVGATPAQGFAGDHSYEFTFALGVTVVNFSLRMFDFGDYNPTYATSHTVNLTAYDASDNPVDLDSLSYNTPSQRHPRSSSNPDYGDLWYNGDACTAPLGYPGYREFKVQGSAIAKVKLAVTAGIDPYIGIDSIQFGRVVSVTVDIKPGSDPNCFNINGHGVIPVAILGSADFDVTQVDVSSLMFAGLEVRVRGNKGPLCSFEDSNGDSFLDLVCHFEDDAGAWVPGNATATLTGSLLAEFGGTPLEGTDSICVVP
ncbi:MAG: hypothetical protein ACFE9C_17325 [Candidatus Hodarchaeota archaeon]